MGTIAQVFSSEMRTMRSQVEELTGEEVLAVGQLRQGRTPSMVAMLTGTALIEVLRPSKMRGEAVPNRLVWAGGYSQEIEYTRSSLFDIYFYDLFLRTNGKSEIARVERTVDEVNKTMPGLAESLKLCIVARVSSKRFRDLIKGEDILD